MKYPQLSLRETNAPYMEEMKTAAAEVIEGGWYIRGKYVSRLEEQLCAYLGCRYAVATDNFSTNSLALVLSSTLYDAGDYIEDFEEYRTLLKGRNDE